VSRIDERFARLRGSGTTGLVTYVTAGDPDLETTRELVIEAVGLGADLVELGVPFSDPMADGPILQRALKRALASGVTLKSVLGMLKTLRPSISAPIVIFSYANPILRMGLDRFVEQAAAAGVDGVLTLDMPPEEGEEFRQAFAKARIDTIFLLSPTTTVERIGRASELGRFLYGISRLGVTGVRDPSMIQRELAEQVKSETAAAGAGLASRALSMCVRSGSGLTRRSSAVLRQGDRGARTIRGIIERSGAVRAMAAERVSTAPREIDKIDEVIVPPRQPGATTRSPG
jgi:tryptophan synthase alpha chain